MSNLTIKIHGQSGQGIETLGMILANSILSSGYKVFTHREYPSLIKGGNANFQIDLGINKITSPSKNVDICVVLNKLQTLWKIDEIRENGILVFDIQNPKFSRIEYEELKRKNITALFIDSERLISENKAEVIMKNIIVLGFLIKLLNLEIKIVSQTLKAGLGKHLDKLDMNLKMLQLGYEYQKTNWNESNYSTHPSSEMKEIDLNPVQNASDNFLNKLNELTAIKSLNVDGNITLMTGNEALCIGAISAGLKFFFGYPMTPASGILKYLTEYAFSSSSKNIVQNDTQLYARQVEDEISAIAMSLGASLGGARSMTATSGGGYDLMVEHISFAGMTETPIIIIIAQRPGPATGLPTWTAQGDLNLAIYGGHGEFPKLVIAVSDPYSCNIQIQNAFNLADKYQIPVIVLTDKFLAESNFTIDKSKFEKLEIKNYTTNLDNMNDPKRFEITETGVSPRWLPGTIRFDYDINSDEHDEYGNLTEDAEMSEKMFAKRMKKMNFIESELPDPEIFTNEAFEQKKNLDKLKSYICWGTTKNILRTHLAKLDEASIPAQFLHFEYLWPLKTEKLKVFLNKFKNAIVVENNFEGQFANLIQQKTGFMIENRINNFNGRNISLED